MLKGSGRSAWETSQAYYTVGYVLFTADVWAATVHAERNLSMGNRVVIIHPLVVPGIIFLLLGL